MRSLLAKLRQTWRWAGHMRIRPETVLRDDAVWVRGVPVETAMLVFGPLGITAVWIAIIWGMGLPGIMNLALYAAAAWPVIAMLAVLFGFPPFEARIGDGMVEMATRGILSLGRRGWSEPLTAYRGLHAMIERWEGPAPLVDRDRAEGRIRGAGEVPRMEVDRSLTPRYRDGLLVLEHATKPGRNLVLARRTGRGIDNLLAKEIAERIGLPLRWTH